jgi:carboxyl-terminal processing protease
MIRTVSSIVILAMLSACSSGDGGGGLGQGGDNNNKGNNDGWQQGVFLDWAGFYQQCNTTLDQNNFLRSYSNDTYLWYDEIVDRDPGLYNDPLQYFDLLVTNELSPSGQPKDKFHFTYDTDEWEQLSQSGVSAGYGIQWAFLSTTPPRDLRIAYTEPNSPAANLAEPLTRGVRILEIDGVDINDNTQAGIDTLNAGIYPAPGEEHTFTVQDLGAAGTRTVTMTAGSITSAPVQNTQVISTQTGEVGYLTFNDHIATAEQALIDAVNTLNAHDGGNGINDLVLDLRYNGGGYLAIASELAYMIAGSVPTAGMTFDALTFNDKHPVTNPVTGQPLEPTPFYTEALGAPFNGTPGQALPTLDLPRVFVLTGGGTCSASEAIINGLRGVGVEVIQIGSTTCGKPYGFYATDNCGTTYFTIQFKGSNAMGFGDYSDGFSPDNTVGVSGVAVPGCSVADDFTKVLGDPTENRLAAALQYRDNQTCPAASGVANGELSKAGPTVDELEPVVPKSVWHTNRIYRQ